MKIIVPILTSLTLVILAGVSHGQAGDIAEIERISKSGATLGPEVTSRFPLGEQTLENDTGMNVLIDLSHQANFFAMWRLPRMLRSAGFRATGSQASLDSVLAGDKFSRVRIPVGRRRPFAWWPNARYNAVIGPPNDKGELAGSWLYGNRSEAHAGWFQGKAAALPTGKCVSHQPNKLFDFDKDGNSLDLALPSSENREKWGKGKDWTKIWWVWQKLDDRYGPTWYPRWRWVQYTRWRDEPDRKLTLDETVEDMSIAVGEDLFGFFHKIGTTLNAKRFARTVFNGQTIELPVAPLDTSPAGPARLEPISDYKELQCQLCDCLLYRDRTNSARSLTCRSVKFDV